MLFNPRPKPLVNCNDYAIALETTMNDELKALDETRSEPEYKGNECVLLDGASAIDWGNRITYGVVAFFVIAYGVGFLLDHWTQLHFLELGVCFATCVVGGAYLGITPKRWLVVKWALILTAVFTLGFLAW